MSDVTSQARARSRYKDTPSFAGARGPYLGLLQVPSEFSELDARNYTAYGVEAADVGFPDRIAAAVYGDGNEDLWWVAMLANGIIDPETELMPGRILRVPSRSAVLSFLSRG